LELLTELAIDGWQTRAMDRRSSRSISRHLHHLADALQYPSLTSPII